MGHSSGSLMGVVHCRLLTHRTRKSIGFRRSTKAAAAAAAAAAAVSKCNSLLMSTGTVLMK